MGNRGSFIKLHLSIVREHVNAEKEKEGENMLTSSRKAYEILHSEVARVPLAARKQKYAQRRRVSRKPPQSTRKVGGNSCSVINTGVDLSRYCKSESGVVEDESKRHRHFVLLKVLGNHKKAPVSTTSTTAVAMNNENRMMYRDVVEFACNETFRQNQEEKSMFVGRVRSGVVYFARERSHTQSCLNT